MKKFETLAICRGFALCRGYITPNDSHEYSHSDTSTNARFSQIFYLTRGGGKLYKYDNTIYGESDTPNIWDLREFYKEPYILASGDKGAEWICINPIPANKFFDFELLSTGTKKTIYGNKEKEQSIICLKGTLLINDKVFNKYNYTRILDGKIADITVNNDSEALYLFR